MARTILARITLVIGLLVLVAPAALAQRRTENVILITIDGARHQDIFGGVDLEVLRSVAGKNPVESLATYKKYWAATPEERRAKVMPFFWGTLMAQGSIAGNPQRGSVAKVTNGHHFSYPGYAEILLGQAYDAEIKSNDPIRNPFETVLEFAKRKLGLPAAKVGAFASWGVFSAIVEHVPGTITSNTGVQPWPVADREVQLVNALQEEVLAPWGSIRHDAFTFRLAMTYLKTQRPRVLYLALDETDDWAHDGKYELVLESLARTDRQLQALWEWLQSDPQYRGRTTMVITTDHGRGRGIDDWKSHGKDVPGADEIWAAFISPDSGLRGEWKDSAPIYQNQIAATLARYLGLDFSELRPTAGKAIEQLWRPSTR